MRKVALIVALVVMATFVGSVCYSEDIFIEEVKTLDIAARDYEDAVPVTTFEALEPVMFFVKYTIVGNENRRYRVSVIAEAWGDKVRTKERGLPPGTYFTLNSKLVPDDVDADTYTVNYKVKLKKGGTVWTDEDSSEVTITP